MCNISWDYLYMQLQQQNTNQLLNWQKTPHISPSPGNYGVSVVSFLEKILRIITAPHCMM